MVLTAQPCRTLTHRMLSSRQFSTTPAVLARTRGKLTMPQLNEKLNAIAQTPGMQLLEDDIEDTTAVGHMMLDQQRQLLHYMRLIENEMPRLVAFRKPFFPPPPSHPLIVRSISYGGEEHPATLKRTVVVPVVLLPLKDDMARHRFKVLAGPRWSVEPPKDSGLGRTEDVSKHGFFKISCENFPEASMNLKWASDVVDRLILEANNPKNKIAEIPIDTRHLEAKMRKAKKGDHVRGRGGIRPTLKDFPKEWLPVLPDQSESSPSTQ